MGFTFNNRELVVNINIEELTVVEGIESKPPSGKCKINNIYVDPDLGKQITEYDDSPS